MLKSAKKGGEALPGVGRYTEMAGRKGFSLTQYTSAAVKPFIVLEKPHMLQTAMEGGVALAGVGRYTETAGRDITGQPEKRPAPQHTRAAVKPFIPLEKPRIMAPKRKR